MVYRTTGLSGNSLRQTVHTQLMVELQMCTNVGRSTSFHCTNSNVLSGSQWYIHVLSPVTNDDNTVLCRMCMNPAGLEIKLPADANHVH